MAGKYEPVRLTERDLIKAYVVAAIAGLMGLGGVWIMYAPASGPHQNGAGLVGLVAFTASVVFGAVLVNWLEVRMYKKWSAAPETRPPDSTERMVSGKAVGFGSLGAIGALAVLSGVGATTSVMVSFLVPVVFFVGTALTRHRGLRLAIEVSERRKRQSDA